MIPVRQFSRCFRSGFTLAELLISLAILGLIATFTIPKVLQNQQEQKKRAAAKEAISAISQSLVLYVKNTGPLTITTRSNDIIAPYISYITVKTGGEQIDNYPAAGTTLACSGPGPCYYLHNGGILRPQVCHFSGLASTNAVTYHFDADGVYTGVDDSVMFFLFPNGRVTSRAQTADTITNSCGTYSASPASDPSWFTW